MGAAAHNRGSKVIRDQIDRELAGRPKEHPSEIALRHSQRANERLKAENARVTKELERAKRYMLKARAERDVLKEELVEQKRLTELMRDAAKTFKRGRDRFERAWLKASNLIKLLPQDLVQAARDTGLHRINASKG